MTEAEPMMLNLPLHHYFSTLGAKASFNSPEVILVDDNARVSAPYYKTISQPCLKKLNRWDSTGCLPRLASETSLTSDTSPSLLKHCKSLDPCESLVPSAPILRRCRSEQGLYVSSSNEGYLATSMDKPLRKPVRDQTLNSLDESSERHHVGFEKSSIDSGFGGMPIRMCGHTYEMTLSSRTEQQDNSYDFDFDQGLDIDWEPHHHSIPAYGHKSIASDMPATAPSRTSPIPIRTTFAVSRTAWSYTDEAHTCEMEQSESGTARIHQPNHHSLIYSRSILQERDIGHSLGSSPR